MKKIFTLLFLSTIAFVSCEGPEGPPGFDGRDGLNGLDGAEELASVFEIENVTFNTANDFAIGFTFPQNIFDADNVIVYRLEEINNGRDVWEPLPANLFFDGGGFLQYRFNFTVADVNILLESDDFGALETRFTDNQVFRIVVIPSAFAQTKNIEQMSLQELMTSLKLDSKDVIKVPINE